MSNLTAEVRAALAKVTPGPWEAHHITEIDPDGAFDLAHVIADDPDDPHGDQVAVAPSILRADADLIAAAPSWLAALCDRLDAAEAKYERLRRILGGDGPFACCECCPDDDPAYHAENPPNSHDLPCTRCSGAAQVSDLTARADAAETKLAAARAALSTHTTEAHGCTCTECQIARILNGDPNAE